MGAESVKSNQKNSLFRAAAKVGSWTMLSRILGFIRDIFIARLLGASPLADAFFVAFKLPNFFRRMFAEGTLTVALVPVLAEQRKKGEEDAHAYLNALAGLLLAALLVFTIIGMVFMPWLLFAFAPGFHDDPDRWQQALTLARIMFPYLALISLAAMSWAVLNAYRKFSVAAASPALLNIAIIFAAIILAPLYDNPAEALAVGVILGGALQLAIQFPALKRIGWIPKPTWNPKLPAITDTMFLFGPAVLGIAAVQINILVGTILATLLPTGAVSYLYYADRIVQLPLALFGIAMGTALLPALSEHFANNRTAEAKQDLRQGLTWLTWIILPSMVGILFLAEPIIRTLFENGAFTALDAANTAHALQAYTVGLLVFCWARVLSTACFAGKDAKAPMRYAMYTVVVNIILAVILMQPLGYVGLALASALASFFNVALLWVHLHKKHGAIFNLQSWKRMASAVLACLPMAALLYYLPSYWGFPSDKFMQFMWLTALVVGSMLTFFASAWTLGERKLLKRA
ncbi:MAG: murein biosynthesis integral membrane protein MurJ [Ghiorsea sp.]|nr:murein biosynthesis integral membrane protein MurJ [Ghiorsea sp.]